MNDLERYFNENTGHAISKWHHYFEIYDRHLSQFRGTDVHLLEFGVFQGGSLQMWKNYFGPHAKIFGVDINPHCRQVAEQQVEILIGDQGNRNFLKSLATQIPRIDILIDDGGHTMEQQINTYEELFHHIGPNGVYICEDLHTSYWVDWDGGYQRPGLLSIARISLTACRHGIRLTPTGWMSANLPNPSTPCIFTIACW